MAQLEGRFPGGLSLTGPGSVQSGYVAFNVDADSGGNEARINGLPSGTKSISVWMTEDKGGKSHIGAIRYETKSVQLGANTCRVLFHLHANAGEHWPTGAMVIVGA